MFTHVPDRFLVVMRKFRGQNSWEDTILVPSAKFANFNLSSWFNLGPNAKLLTKMTLNREHQINYCHKRENST